VAEATERVEALKTHLNLFKDYYRYVILRGLPPAEMLSRLATGLPPDRRNQLLQPRILAWRGDQVAVPVDPNADPLLAEVLDSVSEGLKDLPKVASFYASMPTPGLAMETRLGHCSGCEPYLEDSRAIELSQRKLALAAGEIELERGKARLSASPPDLSPPNLGPQPALSVRLETPPKP
jgi:hypothetical protein